MAETAQGSNKILSFEWGVNMREIKFRAWDKKTKKMRDVGMVSFHNKRSSFDYNASNLPKVYSLWGKDIIDDKDVCLHREPPSVILEQYTGQKDKNGTEIYEGDIVEINMGYITPSILEVVYGGHWEYAAFGLHGKRRKKDTTESDYSWDILNSATAKDCEIIGNIHENPELLENEDE